MSLKAKIAHYARFTTNPLSLPQMASYGRKPSLPQLYRSALFLSDELPIRLAQRVIDLQTLPDGLAEMAPIKKVKRWYEESFEEILGFNENKYGRLITPDLKSQLLAASSNAIQGVLETDPKSLLKQDFTLLLEDINKRGTTGKETKNDNNINHNTKKKGLLGTIANMMHSHSPTVNSEWPEEVLEYNSAYAELLTQVRKRHDAVVPTVAMGVREYKNQPNKSINPEMERTIQAFLDRFYTSRIGIRILISQHVELCAIGTGKLPASHVKKLVEDGYIGIISAKTHIKDVAEGAIELARHVCEDWYGLFDAPKVELICDTSLQMMYIPAHLNHMIFEIVKNSLRATVELYGTDSHDTVDYPPIKVIVADGKEDITIKISDQGGGIARSNIPNVWNYLFTTVEQTPDLEPDFNQTMMGAPMAGFGYGLPISRLYARYFGGDVQLISLESYGTDVYLHLNKLNLCNEPIA